MKLIPLTKGYFAQIDDEDFERVSQFKWCVTKCRRQVYACRSTWYETGRRTKQFLHRFLLNPSAEENVDHKDGNGLNNQRNNLRKCTAAQNQHSFRRKSKNSTSPYRGVSWNSRNKRWQARIDVAEKSIYLGYFDYPEEAARAYDAAARHHFGEFAHLNFPV